MENFEITLNLLRKAKADNSIADELIEKFLPFIRHQTEKFLSRALKGQDDELSIAMFAFYESILSYDEKKGAFFSFAGMNIRNRLIDFYRKEKRHKGSSSLDEALYENENGEKTLLDDISLSHDNVSEKINVNETRQEIEKFAEELALFGLNLSDVASSCPKQERTLNACMLVLEAAKQNEDIIDRLLKTQKLPISKLSELSGVSEKVLERHRKYIIAIILAYTNGFEIIRGHISQIPRKEQR